MTKSSLFVLLTASVLAQGQAQTKQKALPAGNAKAIVRREVLQPLRDHLGPGKRRRAIASLPEIVPCR